MDDNNTTIITGVTAVSRLQQRLTVLVRLCFESPGDPPTVKNIGFDVALPFNESGDLPESRKVVLAGGRAQAITHPHGGGYALIENVGTSAVQVRGVAITINPKRVAFFEMTASPMSLIAIDDSAVRLLFFPSLEATTTPETTN